MNNISKARHSVVTFCEGISIDGYQWPDGSFGVGIASASVTLGYAKNWLGRALNSGGSRLKAIQAEGFSGKVESAVTDTSYGQRNVSIISLEDFYSLMLYAYEKGKPEARALLRALARVSLDDFFRDSFGDRPLTMPEKRQNFIKAYADSLTRQDWLDMDRQEVALIEEQLAFVGEL